MSLSRTAPLAQGAAPARTDYTRGLLVAIVAGVSALVLLQVAIVLWMGFVTGDPISSPWRYGGDNYIQAFCDPFTLGVIGNTVVFSLAMLVVAMAFGIPAAWLAERTDFPGQTVIFTTMTIGLLIPGYATAMGWLFLLHPRVGLVNHWLVAWLGLERAPFTILSLWGMAFVQGLTLAPLAFIMTAASFRAIDPALEEAGLVCGASYRATWWHVTLRLAWPSVLAAAMFMFTIGFATFDIPAIIGWPARIFTFSTYLFSLFDTNVGQAPKYGIIAALSTAMVALAGVMSWWYGTIQRMARRYEVVTGKAYRPRILALGRFVWLAWMFVAILLLLSEVLPILVLVWMSLIPYLQVPSFAAFKLVSLANFHAIGWDLAYRAIGNTAVLMVLTPVITLAASVAFSWVVLRSRVPGRAAFDFIAFLPHAIPSVVFGVATLLVALFVIDKIVPIYGTIWLLLLSFVVGRISYGTRMTNGGLIQINRELDECALINGAATWGVLKEVLLPLLAPTLLYTGLWIALLCFRELTLAVFLTVPGNMTLAVFIWGMWTGGNQGPAAAMTLIMLVLMAPLVAAYWVVARRRAMIADA
jgi:iron(III) transport system permease protein